MSSVALAATRAARAAGDLVDRALARPRATLLALACVQLGATVVFALAVATHNGWVWFQGGDQIWYTSDAWLLGRLTLPPADVGFGWPLLLVPAGWALGKTFVEQLPLVIALDLLVLAPLALVCVHTLGTRIGGRLLGLWASVLWIAAPFAAIPLFVERYHERWVDQFLPQALGLTALADYASMVAALVVAVFVVRALERRAWEDAAVAGLVLGFAGLMKPPNYLLVAGVGLAFLVGRRWRELVVAGAAVLPSLVALAVFKERGLGFVPAFSLEETRLAAGSVLAELDADRYLRLDLDHWRTQMAQLREYFWSARVAQWAPLAGVIAVTRARPAIAALLAGWLAAFLLVKGTSTQASIEANTFWRLLMPAWPAYLLLLASIPLLVPTLARRLGARRVSPESWQRATGRRAVVAAAGSLALAPLALVAVVPGLNASDPFVVRPERETITLTPVAGALTPAVSRTDRAVRLSWDAWESPSQVSYRVYRQTGAESDVVCGRWGATDRCTLAATPVADVTGTTWVDPDPPAEAVYRVGAAVRYDGGVEGSDVFVLSPPVAVP